MGRGSAPGRRSGVPDLQQSCKSDLLTSIILSADLEVSGPLPLDSIRHRIHRTLRSRQARKISMRMGWRLTTTARAAMSGASTPNGIQRDRNSTENIRPMTIAANLRR